MSTDASDVEGFSPFLQAELGKAKSPAAKANVVKKNIGFCLSEESIESSYFQENLDFLESKAIEVLAPSIKKVLERVGLEDDGEVALAIVAYDYALSLNGLSLDVLRRSYYGATEDDFFEVSSERYASKLIGTLELRGSLFQLGVELPDEEETTHWSNKLFKKASTVSEFQGLSWKVIEGCLGVDTTSTEDTGTKSTNDEDIDDDLATVDKPQVAPKPTKPSKPENCSVIDKKKIQELYAGTVGPADNVDFIPPIRKEFIDKNIPLENVEQFEKKGKYSAKDITEDDIREFEDSNQLTSKSKLAGLGSKLNSNLSNQIRSAVASSQTKHEEALASKQLDQDIARQESLVAAQKRAEATREAEALREEADLKSKNAQQEAIALLDQLDVKNLMDQGEAALQNEVDKVKGMVQASQSFANTGQSFQGLAALQQELLSGAMKLNTTGSAIQSYRSNEELVASVAGGTALHGIGLLLDDYPVVSAGMPVLKRPAYVSMLGVTTPFQTHTFKTTSEKESNTFHKSASAAGMSIAESSSKSFGASASASGYGFSGSVSHSQASSESSSMSVSSEKSKSKESQRKTTTAFLSEYVKMPMRSFRVPYDAMRLSEDAIRAVFKIDTEREALAFMRSFGSHFPFGMQTMGGVFFRNITMTTQEEVTTTSIYSAAGQTMSQEKGKSSSTSASAGGRAWGVSVSASASMSNASKSGSTRCSTKSDAEGESTASTEAFYTSTVTSFGPNAATPEDFSELLSNNTGTWSVIDRGPMDQLLAIWEFIDDELVDMSKVPVDVKTAIVNDEIKAAPSSQVLEESLKNKAKRAIRLMRRVWMRKAEEWMNSPDPPVLPLMMMRALQDEVAKRRAIGQLVKGICAVIVPSVRSRSKQHQGKLGASENPPSDSTEESQPGSDVDGPDTADDDGASTLADDGDISVSDESQAFVEEKLSTDRLSMLQSLKLVVRTATRTYLKEMETNEFEYGNFWIRKFIERGTDPKNQNRFLNADEVREIAYDFEAKPENRDKDTLPNNEYKRISEADANAFKATRELGEDEWEWLVDDFVAFAKRFYLPYFTASDDYERTVYLWNCLHQDSLRRRKRQIITEDETLQSEYGTKLQMLCPDGVTEKRVAIDSGRMRQYFSLFPGMRYFLVYRDNSSPRSGFEIVSEDEFLNRGNIVFINKALTPVTFQPSNRGGVGYHLSKGAIDKNSEGFAVPYKMADKVSIPYKMEAKTREYFNVDKDDEDMFTGMSMAFAWQANEEVENGDPFDVAPGLKYFVHPKRTDPFYAGKATVSDADKFTENASRDPPKFLIISKEKNRRLFAQELAEKFAAEGTEDFGTAPEEKRVFHINNFWSFPRSDAPKGVFTGRGRDGEDFLFCKIQNEDGRKLVGRLRKNDLEEVVRAVPDEKSDVSTRDEDVWRIIPFKESFSSSKPDFHKDYFLVKHEKTGKFLCEVDLTDSPQWGETILGDDTSRTHSNDNEETADDVMVNEGALWQIVADEEVQVKTTLKNFRYITYRGNFVEHHRSLFFIVAKKKSDGRGYEVVGQYGTMDESLRQLDEIRKDKDVISGSIVEGKGSTVSSLVNSGEDDESDDITSSAMEYLEFMRSPAALDVPEIERKYYVMDEKLLWKETKKKVSSRLDAEDEWEIQASQTVCIELNLDASLKVVGCVIQSPRKELRAAVKLIKVEIRKEGETGFTILPECENGIKITHTEPDEQKCLFFKRPIEAASIRLVVPKDKEVRRFRSDILALDTTLRYFDYQKHVVHNPDEDHRFYMSKSGLKNGSMLDFGLSFNPPPSRSPVFNFDSMSIDLGQKVRVVGVCVQGSTLDDSDRATHISVATKSSQEGPWELVLVESKGIEHSVFPTNCKPRPRHDEKFKIFFSERVSRYVSVCPQKYIGWPCMRWAVLLATDEEKKIPSYVDQAWRHVRHVPMGSNGQCLERHFDQSLGGKGSYGDSQDNTQAWSLDFEKTLPGYNEFRISTTRGRRWVEAFRSQVSLKTSSSITSKRVLNRTSASESPLDVTWIQEEDFVGISTSDFDRKTNANVVYAQTIYKSAIKYLPFGSDVYIRRRALSMDQKEETLQDALFGVPVFLINRRTNLYLSGATKGTSRVVSATKNNYEGKSLFVIYKMDGGGIGIRRKLWPSKQILTEGAPAEGRGLERAMQRKPPRCIQDFTSTPYERGTWYARKTGSGTFSFVNQRSQRYLSLDSSAKAFKGKRDFPQDSSVVDLNVIKSARVSIKAESKDRWLGPIKNNGEMRFSGARKFWDIEERPKEDGIFGMESVDTHQYLSTGGTTPWCRSHERWRLVWLGGFRYKLQSTVWNQFMVCTEDDTMRLVDDGDTDGCAFWLQPAESGAEGYVPDLFDCTEADENFMDLASWEIRPLVGPVPREIGSFIGGHKALYQKATERFLFINKKTKEVGVVRDKDGNSTRLLFMRLRDRYWVIQCGNDPSIRLFCPGFAIQHARGEEGGYHRAPFIEAKKSNDPIQKVPDGFRWYLSDTKSGVQIMNMATRRLLFCASDRTGKVLVLKGSDDDYNSKRTYWELKDPFF